MIWAYLAHVSFNMWEEADVKIPPSADERLRRVLELRRARPTLRFDDGVWERLLEALQGAGANMVVLDLGDGVRYDSHPEIAVENAWTTERLRREVRRLRSLGLEPIPKLNFSTAHDTWLGPYSRCVSTDAYYTVCRDLIAEVSDLFDTPRFFHLGMDEETAEHQRHYHYAVVRQHDLWWHDLGFLAGECERHGTRPWMWSDYGWNHWEAFRDRMPTSVLQSNWYYGDTFPLHALTPETARLETEVQIYDRLDLAGFDQIPTGSNWNNSVNFERTVAYCRSRIAPERLKGFMQTPWQPTIQACEHRLLAAVAQMSNAMGIEKNSHPVNPVKNSSS